MVPKQWLERLSDLADECADPVISGIENGDIATDKARFQLIRLVGFAQSARYLLPKAPTT